MDAKILAEWAKDLSEDALLEAKRSLRLAKFALELSIAALLINLLAWWMK